MAYINQTEINNFINKAQQKIALLGIDIATATENDLPYDDEMALSDELSSFINSLIDPWLDWDESDILRYIHFYNNKAKITDIPFSAIPKLRMQVVWPQSLVSGGDVTQAELDAEIAARIAADLVLQGNIDVEKQRIDDLDFTGDLATALTEYTKTTLLFLPIGDNKDALDALTTALVAEIVASTAHLGDGGIHVASGEKTTWNAKIGPTDPRLTDARAPLAHNHPVSDVTGLVTEIETQVDDYVTALDLQDGITPVFVASNVIEGSPLAVDIDDSAGPENLVLNMTVPPPEKGDPGEPFNVDVQGLAADRFDSIYDAEDENFAYLGTDDGNLYFREPSGGPATSTEGWSAGTPFTGENGWSPVLATQTVSADKEVHVILDWIGGTGSKPVFDPPENPPDPLIWYISPSGPTVFVDDATNVKGNQGATGSDGERFIIDDSDLLANKPNYDAELKGFTLLITDVSPNVIYQKISDTSGDWGGAYEWQGPIGGAGVVTVYSSIGEPQLFNPDSAAVAADTDDYTLSSSNSVAFVTLNGQVLDKSEYSLAASVLTVTPDNGFSETDDEVLVFQHEFASTNQGVITGFVSVSANYTLIGTDHTVECTDNSFTISLLSAAVVTAGREFVIANTGTGVITIDPFGAETINGDADFEIYQYESLTLKSNGVNWIII